MMKKNLLVLLLALVLILGNFQANAENRNLPVVGRENLGRKVNAGVSDDKTGNKLGVGGAENNHETINNINSNKAVVNDDNDDKNENYGSYGHDNGSSTGSHHYFRTTNRPSTGPEEPRH